MADSFTVFGKFGDAAALLGEEDRAQFYTAICEYGLFSTTVENLSPAVAALFTLAKEDIDNSKTMRSQGGRGGRPKKAQVEKVSENEKPKVSENPKPRVSENEKPQVSENRKPKPNQTRPNQARVLAFSKSQSQNPSGDAPSGAAAGRAQPLGAHDRCPKCGGKLWRNQQTGKRDCDSCFESFTADELAASPPWEEREEAVPW